MKKILDSKTLRITLYALLGAFSVALFLKNAWLAEDSFILLRSVNQFLHGNGFRWNPHDRTQVYTSPLWFLLVIVATTFCKTLYLNLIGLSLALHMALLTAMGVLLKNIWRWSAAVLLLTLSQGFFDFTSSGLEYPLVFLLLGSFVLLYLRGQHTQDRFWLATCAGLALITRHDLLFIMSPMLAHLAWNLYKNHSPRSLFATFAIFVAPLACWTLFSLIYYGVPFPNTAYAKLSIQGLPESDRFFRGWIYAWVSLKIDPITPACMAFALIQGLFSRNIHYRVLGVSIAVALAYVTFIGADYMMGRFYSPIYLASILGLVSNDQYRFYLPTFLAKPLGQQASNWQHPVLTPIAPMLMAGLLARLLCVYGMVHLETTVQIIDFLQVPNDDDRGDNATMLIIIASIVFSIPATFFKAVRTIFLTVTLYLLLLTTQLHDSPWRTGYADWGKNMDYDIYVAIDTVSRERYWIYRWTSLYAWFHRNPDIIFPDHDWCHAGEQSAPVSIMWGVGMQGYCMPLDHIGFDFNGLVDPLMSRMPKHPDTVWVTGGAIRIIPAGYEKSLREHKNLLEDPDLAHYYDKLAILTQSEKLFTVERIKTIIAFNLGAYDHWLQAYVTRILKNPPPPPGGV
ncbi:MAG TPA: hypothetical protein PLF22_10045 [Pseudomonadales bacterium]|nr:hypothetical protein [Pseudomonadales bacterium]